MKTTLVFGASLKTNRYSNLAIHRLLANGIDTEAFGLKSGKVGSVQIKTKLDELPNIESVTLYMNPERQKQYYQHLIALQPKRIIFNPGTENPELYEILKKEGIEVEVACTLVLLSTGQY